jgi:hypothetical protein
MLEPEGRTTSTPYPVDAGEVQNAHAVDLHL